MHMNFWLPRYCQHKQQMKESTVTPELFANYPTTTHLSQAEQKDVENTKPIGFYHSKAERIIKLAKQMVDEYDNSTRHVGKTNSFTRSGT